MKFLHIYEDFILQEIRVEKENVLGGTGIAVTVSAFGFFLSVMFGICSTLSLLSPTLAFMQNSSVLNLGVSLGSS